MLIITNNQVRELLPMRDCMEVVGQALADLARGDGVQPLRSGFRLPDRCGMLAWMPGSLAGGKPFGVKILSIHDRAAEMGIDSHQGAVIIFDPENGRPLALAEAGAVTAVRTAAVSALATDRLARADATTLAILGAGAQARSHLEAMIEVRSISAVRVWNRTRANADRFATDAQATYGIPIEVAPDVSTAVAGADIVCTTTAAREPVMLGEMLRPGMHVNGVGSSVPAWSELDVETVKRSKLFTDRRESLENEAHEYRLASERGAIANDHLQAELGQVLIGDHPGRTSDDEITLFRSLGLAVEDLAAVELIFERALERGVGTDVDLAG
jgi:ornithine cyclodeaminase/alanine dehydrogenase-like protein (mu-crystallin family)